LSAFDMFRLFVTYLVITSFGVCYWQTHLRKNFALWFWKRGACQASPFQILTSPCCLSIM